MKNCGWLIFLLLLQGGYAAAQNTGGGGGGGGGGFSISGGVTNGHCVSIVNSTTGQDSGGACGGSGSPCVVTAGSLQYNNSGAFGCVPDFTFAVHTVTVGAAGILDLSAASATVGLRFPVAAGAAPTADGQAAVNSTTHLPVFGSNGATVTIPVNTTATGTQFFTAYNSATGAFTKAQPAFTDISGTATTAQLPGTGATTVNSQTCTLGSACTIPFQTNSVSNTSQAGVNFLTSTANSVGLTVTPTNSATNAMKYEVTGASYTGNAATASSAATWTTARNLAGNSVNGSANVAFTNKFIVQGTTDAGLSAAQFLGALGTGPLKNTTTTGILSIAASADISGLWSGTCNSSTFLRGDGACATPAGSGTINAGTQFANAYYSAAGSATTLDGITPGTNQGTYYFARVNTVQGTATAPVDLQAGDCSGGGSSISGATTSYTVLYSDVVCTIVHDRAASGTLNPVTIPTPTTLNNSNPVFVYENDSAQTDVLTPTTFTIALGNAAAAATLNVPSNVSCKVSLDPHNASTWEANCHPNATSGGGGSSAFPITVSGTVTSGGIPYFSATTTETSSALLASNSPMLGGGAGGAPKTVAGITSDGTSKVTLGVAGTSVGAVALNNATSGSVTIQPVTGALGAVTASFPAATGTVALDSASDTTTTHVLHATATGHVYTASAIAAGDLPTTLTSGTAITNAALTTPTLGTPASGTLTNTTGYLEQNLTGASAAGTITEGAATASVTRAGIATANLTAPWVIQNTNSSNNNTSIGLGVSTPGTSTGQTTFNVNGTTGQGNLIEAGTGGAWAAGVLSGQTKTFQVAPTGAVSVGTAPACTAGTAGGWCSTEGTDITGATSVFALNGNSADHTGHWSGNNGTVQHLQQAVYSTGTYTNATTTFSSVTGLSATVAASTNYAMECHLYFQASAGTAGIKAQITGPASPTAVNIGLHQPFTVSTYNDQVATAFSTSMGTTTTTSTGISLEAVLTMGLQNGVNAGTIQVQLASEGTGTLTLNNGSYCKTQ